MVQQGGTELHPLRRNQNPAVLLYGAKIHKGSNPKVVPHLFLLTLQVAKMRQRSNRILVCWRHGTGLLFRFLFFLVNGITFLRWPTRRK